MKKLVGLLLAFLLSFSFVACNNDDQEIAVYMPDGATAISMAYMMGNHSEIEGAKITYNVVPPATIASYAQSKKADLIVLPVNAAINLFTKGAPYKLAAVVTHGNLFIVGSSIEELSIEVESFEDLKGKVIASIGQNNIPAMVLKSILRQNGVEFTESDTAVEGKVAIRYADDGSDVIRMIRAGEVDFGLIAEPAVSNAITNPTLNIKIVFNIQQEWEKLTGKNIYPQAALLVKNETDKKIVNKFLQLLKDNDGWAEQNPKAAVDAIRAHAIEGTESTVQFLSSELIRQSNILTVTSGLKSYIEEFLELIEFTKPSEDFYYTKD